MVCDFLKDTGGTKLPLELRLGKRHSNLPVTTNHTTEAMISDATVESTLQP